HLLVDEYQDTNRVQYLIVKALAARSGNLSVVGDEDQSIYRWRGADIRNILDFERDYPAAQIFKLEQNYRSKKTILAAAGAVIRNNTERKVKNLWTEIGAGSFEAIAELAARERIAAFEAMGRLQTDSKVALRTAKQAGMLYAWMHD